MLEGLTGNQIVQGYLFHGRGWKGRVRREIGRDDRGKEYDLPSEFTLKGPKIVETSPEYSVHIELTHAVALLELAAPDIVEKLRIPVISENRVFDVDYFLGRNEGLVIAEFEGTRNDVQMLRSPWWCGAEVTRDPRFFNENLAVDPWQSWRDSTGDGTR